MAKISPLSYRISFVLKSLYFPLTYPTISDSLKERGYKIQSLPPLPSIPMGGRVYIGGRIASKGECYVDIDPDRKIVGSEGRNVESVIEIVKELEDMITKNFSVRMEEFDYYELVSYLNVTSDKDPMASIRKTFKTECYSKISEVLKQEVSPFVISIAPVDSLPSNKKWFDLTIRPDVISKNVYNIAIVYRHENRDDVLSFAKKIDFMISELIKIIEE